MGNFTVPVKLRSPGYPLRHSPPFHRYHWDISIPGGTIAELVFPEYDVVHYGAYTSMPGIHLIATDINDI